MAKLVEVTINDFVDKVSAQEIFKNELVIIEVNGAYRDKIDVNKLPVKFDALSIMFACRGEMTVNIDYLNYTLRKNMTLELGKSHIIESVQMTWDFKGYHILISHELMLDIVKEIKLRLPDAFDTSIRYQPVQKQDEEDFRMLLELLERIRKNIARTDHFFQRNIIRNDLCNLILEMGDIALRKRNIKNQQYEVSHKEEIVKEFIKLLILNCKEKHDVTFYSTELCITPEYLSRIMKAFSGKTVNKWISDALLGEAKILLRRPDMNIQQIAEELKFSDQSSFGKFFKKHTGKSPLEYKNMQIDR